MKSDTVYQAIQLVRAMTEQEVLRSVGIVPKTQLIGRSGAFLLGAFAGAGLAMAYTPFSSREARGYLRAAWKWLSVQVESAGNAESAGGASLQSDERANGSSPHATSGSGGDIAESTPRAVSSVSSSFG